MGQLLLIGLVTLTLALANPHRFVHGHWNLKNLSREAAGLAAAIPAVIAFNHFSNRIGMLEAELNNFSADFLNIVERDILFAGGNRK